MQKADVEATDVAGTKKEEMKVKKCPHRRRSTDYAIGPRREVYYRCSKVPKGSGMNATSTLSFVFGEEAPSKASNAKASNAKLQCRHWTGAGVYSLKHPVSHLPLNMLMFLHLHMLVCGSKIIVAYYISM